MKVDKPASAEIRRACIHPVSEAAIETFRWNRDRIDESSDELSGYFVMPKRVGTILAKTTFGVCFLRFILLMSHSISI